MALGIPKTMANSSRVRRALLTRIVFSDTHARGSDALECMPTTTEGTMPCQTHSPGTPTSSGSTRKPSENRSRTAAASSRPSPIRRPRTASCARRGSVYASSGMSVLQAKLSGQGPRPRQACGDRVHQGVLQPPQTPLDDRLQGVGRGDGRRVGRQAGSLG